MSNVQPAIEILERRASELRDQLSGIEAAIGVLRGSTSLTPIDPRSLDDDLEETVGADAEEILAAVDELGARAFVVNLATHLEVPKEDLRKALAHLEEAGKVRVVALGPKHGLVERLETLPVLESEVPSTSAADLRDRAAAAIAQLGPAATNEQIAERVGTKRGYVNQLLRDLEGAGRIRRTGSTLKRRIELVETSIADESTEGPEVELEAEPAETPVADDRSSSLDRETETEHAPVEEPAPAAPVPKPRRVNVPKPQPAARRRSVPAHDAPPAPASKIRRAPSADEQAAIARHLAEKGARRYEAGTLVGILERTFVAEGSTFAYDAGPKAARAPYVINGRNLTAAKTIERANEIRHRKGLEPIAVPGKAAKGGKR